MKNNLLQNTLLICAGAVITFASCERDPEPDITADNLKGMFVICEGAYGSAEGDITWYDTEDGSTVKSLFYSVNGAELGDIVQSFAIADTLGFIAVNNSQKVTVVNLKNFTTVKNLNNFSYPRSVARADENTIYVTNGNGSADNYIYSIDITTLKKADSLEVSTGPESLLTVGGKVYATISGGWNNDGNSVIEIDQATFTITNTYTVGSCPVDLVADKDKNIWVSLNVQDVETIVADEDKIIEVLLNLLTNAIKFNVENGKISVRVFRIEDHVRIEIQDTGIGIKKEELDVIFDEFRQLDSSETKAYRGTGLGLSISKHYVALHGGLIWAESELGKGSTFIVEIPRETGEE
jgi:hypothetical protein